MRLSEQWRRQKSAGHAGRFVPGVARAWRCLAASDRPVRPLSARTFVPAREKPRKFARGDFFHIAKLFSRVKSSKTCEFSTAIHILPTTYSQLNPPQNCNFASFPQKFSTASCLVYDDEYCLLNLISF
jgi:hypothetical protein